MADRARTALTQPVTDPTPNRPLWEVMRHAYDQRSPESDDRTDDRLGYAAEIRALADWLVPEEKPPGVYNSSSYTAFRTREGLRHRLLAEADRAEAVE